MVVWVEAFWVQTLRLSLGFSGPQNPEQSPGAQ